MKYLFENVFYKKSEGDFPDEFMNISYWLILSTTNVLKWLFASYLFVDTNDYVLLILLFISPMIKFMAIGVGNIRKFRKVTRNWILIGLMILIVWFESFYELPCHVFFPKNYIYLHTNYYKIYDLAKYRLVEIITQLLDNALVLVFLYFSFKAGNLGIVSILALSFCLVTIVYFILAEFFYLFLAKHKPKNEVDDYGRTTRRHKIKAKLDEMKVKNKMNFTTFGVSRKCEKENKYYDGLDDDLNYNRVEVLDKKCEELDYKVKYTETERSSDVLTK